MAMNTSSGSCYADTAEASPWPGKGDGKGTTVEVAKKAAKQSEPADYRNRDCKVCGTVAHWRHMKHNTLPLDADVLERAGTSAEKNDVLKGRQIQAYEFTCVDCYAQAEGISKDEALNRIKQKKQRRGCSALRGSRKPRIMSPHPLTFLR